MPSAIEGAKGRAKLFKALDRSGAHFIALGSGSSSSAASSDDDADNSVGGDEEKAPLSATAERKAAPGEGRNAKAHRDDFRQRDNRSGAPSSASESGGLESGEAEGSSTMSVRYSRVTSGDGSSSPITEAERSKRRRSQLADRISNKLHALFWVVVGATVVGRTDFLRVLMEDERVDRIWFNIGVVCFSINAVILAYLTVWLPHVRGIKVSWNVYSPRAIPTATVIGIICALALNVSLWGVWGFLTPLILFAVFIGCLFSLHFVPWPC